MTSLAWSVSMLEIRADYPNLDEDICRILIARNKTGATINDIKEDYRKNVAKVFPVPDVLPLLLSIPSVTCEVTPKGTLYFRLSPSERTQHLFDEMKDYNSDQDAVNDSGLGNHNANNNNNDNNNNNIQNVEEPIDNAPQAEENQPQQEQLVEVQVQEQPTDNANEADNDQENLEQQFEELWRTMWVPEVEKQVGFVDNQQIEYNNEQQQELDHVWQVNAEQHVQPPIDEEWRDVNENEQQQNVDNGCWVVAAANQQLTSEEPPQADELWDAENQQQPQHQQLRPNKVCSAYNAANYGLEPISQYLRCNCCKCKQIRLQNVHKPREPTHCQCLICIDDWDANNNFPSYQQNLHQHQHQQLRRDYAAPYPPQYALPYPPVSRVTPPLPSPPSTKSNDAMCAHVFHLDPTITYGLKAHAFLGDDLFLHMLQMELGCDAQRYQNVLQSGLCVSGQTINEAFQRVQKLPYFEHGKTIIVNIGSVDIMKGHPLCEVQQDYMELVNELLQKGLRPILTTLVPLANCMFNNVINKNIHRFNSFIKRVGTLQVIDLWSELTKEDFKPNLNYYQTCERTVSGSDLPFVFWNQTGRRRILHRISQDLLSE